MGCEEGEAFGFDAVSLAAVQAPAVPGDPRLRVRVCPRSPRASRQPVGDQRGLVVAVEARMIAERFLYADKVGVEVPDQVDGLIEIVPAGPVRALVNIEPLRRGTSPRGRTR